MTSRRSPPRAGAAASALGPKLIRGAGAGHRRGQKPTRDFQPGGFRLRFADQTGCAIAVDFVS